MGSIRNTLVLASSLTLIGCASTPSENRVVASDNRTSSLATGLESDEAQIKKSLSTMDEADREVATSKMEWLIDQGLYDPENENPLKVGEPAPDFELMPLRFYDFAIAPGITKANAGSLFEPVRLSSFKGSLPVVLIFGSYT
jgi:hypothetical protein